MSSASPQQPDNWPQDVWAEWDSGWSTPPVPPTPEKASSVDFDEESLDSLPHVGQDDLSPQSSHNSQHVSLERRLADLVYEAELSDQRIVALEDLLLAAESAQRAQDEERQNLEAWVEGIERRFGLIEQEHQAEVENLQRTIEMQKEDIKELQHRLSEVASGHGVGADAIAQFEETIERLQSANQDLADDLKLATRRCRELEDQLANGPEEESETLRLERAELAQQRAELARQRHDLVTELNHVTALPKQDNSVDTEMSCRIRALREHLREIHAQEQQEQVDTSLVSRLSNLWHRLGRSPYDEG